MKPIKNIAYFLVSAVFLTVLVIQITLSVVAVKAQTTPVQLANGWMGGTVVPTSCSSGNSRDFYNPATNMLFRCIGNVYQNGTYLATSANLSAQGADVTLVNLLTNSIGGTYEMSCYAVVTRAATTSSTLPACAGSYTDMDTSVVETPTLSGAQTGNTLGLTGGGANLAPVPSIIRVKAGTTIAWATSGYASVGGTSMQFAVHVRLVFIG
jgi:hypothetical protein